MKFIPEKMIRDFKDEVYEKISQITELKFKSQIKNSGIVFKNIYEMTDLTTNQKSYLIFTNSDSIWFYERDDFIEEFIQHAKKV